MYKIVFKTSSVLPEIRGIHLKVFGTGNTNPTPTQYGDLHQKY